MNYKYLFGPVISRRLGISLGIDLVPFKTCSLDCIYCECGGTTKLTLERKEYIPTEDVIKEINDYLKNKPKLDYITFSGSGEPTLHTGLSKIIMFIKTKFPEYKTALLTNGTLLYDKKLQTEIRDIDVVLPSLDAISDKVFNKINRPIKKLKNSKIINGIIDFNKNYSGKIWIEIFIIHDLNDNKKELDLFIDVLKKIKPELIQLNSLDRPGTENRVKKTSYEDLLKIKNYFKEFNNVEIISKYNPDKSIETLSDNKKELILSTIKRRPCSFNDLLKITNLDIDDLKIYLDKFLNEKLIEISCVNGNEFYKIN